MPCRDVDPGCSEVGELWKVCPDIARGPPQDGWILALSIEDRPRSTVVHIGPERCHDPSVPGDWKGYRRELRHLSQEGHKAIVVNLRRRNSRSEINDKLIDFPHISDFLEDLVG